MEYYQEFRVAPGEPVELSQQDPAFTGDYSDRKQAKGDFRKAVKRLKELQYLLYAEDRRTLLIVLQAMDAGGKDGTIRKVLGPINPQGCSVTSFKAPSAEELAHDFLWRIHKAMPRRGVIGVFNRSHYEDVLVVRVHSLVPKSIWSTRYDQINAFEKMLSDNGGHILKFFLHISKEEQLARFRKRLDDPKKNWKVNPQDFQERKLWGEYMKAYEDALARCSAPHAPWFIVPSNHKWYRNLVVSQIIVETLESLDMKLPKPSFDVSKLILE